MKPALVDTSYLVSLYDKNDSHHFRCVRVHEVVDRPLITCEAVLTETLHLLRRIPGTAQAILANVEKGILEIPFELCSRSAAVSAILHKYRDLPASLADACLVQMADELGSGDILTLDSDFRRYRWRRNRSFRLLIPLE